MIIQIYDIRDQKERLDAAVDYFWKQWGTDSNFNFYKDCIEQSCNTDSDVPRFYIAIQKDTIIGSYALLRSELNSRQDLTPWFACLFVDPLYRGNKLGSLLQKHAVEQTKTKGYQRLYLCTDLLNYYEKSDWKYAGQGYLINNEQTRIYVHELEAE